MSDLARQAESQLQEVNVEIAMATATVAIAYELGEIRKLLGQLVEQQGGRSVIPG